MFVRIQNKKAFLLEEVPNYHPESQKYYKFWKEQKQRCIEGFWALDTKDETVDNEWRWMPPNLYFYVNFGTILHKEKKGEPRKKIRPYLRDVEWEFFYNWAECRGFSGFEDDDEYTCNRSLIENVIGGIPDSCYDINGELKKYIPTTDYLRMRHAKPLGKALWENEALNLFVLGARGFGKSYMVGVGIILHEWLFDGSKNYNEESIKNPGTVEVFVGAAISSKSTEILDKTYTAFINMPGQWGEGKSYKPSPFFKRTQGSLNANNMKNPFRHEYEKKVGNEWKILGSKSSVKHGIYTVENPEVAAGTRPSVMVVEEVGLMSNLLKVHGSNTACQQIGTDRFGSSVYIGTGGNMEKIVESQIIFNDPVGFGFLPFDNVWEESQNKIGWFVPAIYNANEFKDEDGNTDVIAATNYYNKQREKKRQSRDRSALALEMMNYPLVPSEMFLNTDINMFPVADLKAQLTKVVVERWDKQHFVGRFIIDSDTGKIDFKNDNDLKIVREFPLKDNKDKPGGVEIFEMPIVGEGGFIPFRRYIACTDPYDDDESGTNSFGSTFVIDTFTERIVAEYFGRPSSVEYYETVLRLCKFYNAQNNYESANKGLFAYFRNKNALHLLADTPESLREVENIKIFDSGNKSKGTRPSAGVNAYGRDLILNWLLKPATVGDNEEYGNLLNLHLIRSEGLLKELIYWNPNGNYDRISSLGMGMILLNDRLRSIEKERTGIRKTPLSQHSFWKRNRGQVDYMTLEVKKLLQEYNKQERDIN